MSNISNCFVGVRIAGIASALPSRIIDNQKDIKNFPPEDIAKIIASTGVEQRHVVTEEQCTSDLCFCAATNLMQELGWEKESIDVLIFISQTPDYPLPPTSCALHSRLGLSKHCVAFDVNLGCSGYVYGLWQAACFLVSHAAKRVLLLVGDTISRISAPDDRSVALLFGDAGTATALEYSDTASLMHFDLGTDGSGYDKLIVPAGGFRTPHSTTTDTRSLREQNNSRSDADLYMNGAEIFAFTLREIPQLIQSVMLKASWEMEQVDAFVLHQANLFMLNHIAKRLKIPEQKLLLSLKKYGNTSSASIPLTLTDQYSKQKLSEPQRLILAGFGVGFSWAGVSLILDTDCKILKLLEVS